MRLDTIGGPLFARVGLAPSSKRRSVLPSFFLAWQRERRGSYNRQGANGYVLSMGTKIWDPEQSTEQDPEWAREQDPEWKILTFRAGFSFVHFRSVLDPEMAGKLQSVQRKNVTFSAF